MRMALLMQSLIIRMVPQINNMTKKLIDNHLSKDDILTDEEMALPGKPVSEEQFDEWNSRSDEGLSISADELRRKLGTKFRGS